jgi:hypothetical protein
LTDAQGHRLVYEALSYTWGDPNDKQEIRLQNSPFPVTKNLHAALVHLRLSYSPRTLWIDAICINQADIEERNRQVKHMREIYTRAMRVIVWLGEEKDAKVGLDYCDTLVRNKRGELPFYAKDKDKRKACDDLFSRPWWSRSWILQEVLHSGDDNVYIGRIRITMENLLAKFEQVLHASDSD